MKFALLRLQNKVHINHENHWDYSCRCSVINRSTKLLLLVKWCEATANNAVCHNYTTVKNVGLKYFIIIL